jgi:formylglycine-generating enzyme
MRLRHLLLAALLASCNSILGNADYHVVATSAGTDSGGTAAGPAKCRLNTNCAQGDVCIFQTCGPPCNGDEDCSRGSRCLKTDTGTACVSASVATCDAGCPAGTTCSPTDGVCRNTCGTTECLRGQTCTNGLCVGTDKHETGSGGSGGSAGTGGGGPEAGAGGAAEPDLCVGKVCDTPPDADCESPTLFKTYDKMGSCALGQCSYTAHSIACTCQSKACTTDPCIAVTCASPPDASCKDPNTLTTYAPSGTCSAGSCSYAPKDKTCDFGCANGACKPDPCASVTCNSAPAAKCKSTGTKTTYAATGTCSEGSCSYTPTDAGCMTNQQCGGAGVCSVCKADATCGASCTACSGGTKKCKDLGTTSKCVACLSNGDCSGATPHCNPANNACEAPPSCVGLAKTCGPAGTADCCASGVVKGGTFNRDNDPAYPATVANFRLDNYEITVGRFRKFVAAYSQTMTAPGAGKNPNNASDTGWDTAWNSSLPAAGMLTNVLKCSATHQTWTDSAGTGAAESLPINCVDWFEAEAFCIWDGGRLPTEAEWNYAAAGGTAQRTYPWGNDTPSCSYANYSGAGGGNLCVPTGTNPVGSESTAGDGLYGQSDLAGNVKEWVQDWYATPYTNPCSNCANLAVSTFQVLRGGGFGVIAAGLPSSYRSGYAPSIHDEEDGARCARNP